MVEAGFQHRIGARLAVFVEQVFFERPTIHTNADRAVMIPRGLDDFFDARLIADVTRVDPQTGSTRLSRLDPAFVVKMDVGHDGHRALAADLFQRFGAVHIRHRDPHDVSPRIRRRQHLFDRGRGIRGDRIRHGLNRDRSVSADRHIAHHNLTGFSTLNRAPGADVVQGHGSITQRCAR